MIEEQYNMKFWVDIAQIATLLLTLIGIIFSFWMSTKTLREVQHDRVIGQRPYLLFEFGGFSTQIQLKKGEDGRLYASFLWAKLESGGIYVPTVGRLKNLGTGPAVGIKLQWIIEEILINGEKIKINGEKRKEIQYSPEYNQNPIRVSHLFPNQESGYHLLPWFISHDITRKIEKADGYLVISYQDTFSNNHKTFQKFQAATDYENMTFLTTFSDLIKNENNYS